MSAEQNFSALKKLYPQAELWQEGNQPLVSLPGIKFQSGGKTLQMDLLLCPRARDSYATRLFFKSQVDGKGDNWRVYGICGQSWHACSIKDIPANLSWAEILACHLRVLQ